MLASKLNPITMLTGISHEKLQVSGDVAAMHVE